jgi:hypothetical protein
MELITDSNRGIYAPQHFAQTMEMSAKNNYECDLEDIKIVLAGPNDDNEDYWEAWNAICDDFNDDEGRSIFHLDGNIFITSYTEYSQWKAEQGIF